MCGREFRDIVIGRYAVKKFDGKKIPEEQLQELFDLIRYAPSGLNFQPWKIKVITDAETKEKLLPASWNQTQIITCSHLLVFCANEHLKEQVEKIAVEMKKSGIDPAAIEQYVKLAKDFLVHVLPEQRKVWTQHNVFLALATALYGAASLGIDSCPMGGFEPEKYAKILNLPPYLIPTMLCALGYAADQPAKKVRLPRDEIFF
jgi:nitroreductase/dihydropteridine reductase